VAVSSLAEGRPVNSIARALGFQPSSFSDMFKRELGAPPSAFDPRATLADARDTTDTQATAHADTDIDPDAGRPAV